MKILNLCVLYFAVAAGLPALASKQSCNEMLGQLRAKAEFVNPKTIGAIGALQTTWELSDANLSARFLPILDKDAYLSSHLTKDERNRLALFLSTQRSRQRDVTRRLVRFFYEKDHAAAAQPANAPSLEVAVSPLDEAKTYVEKNWSQLGKDTLPGIVNYIDKEIFNDPEFQNFPIRYLNNLNEKRGGLEMLVIPSDPALKFLEDLYHRKLLVPIAAQVKATRGQAEALPPYMMEAKAYIDKEWSHFGPSERAGILNYLDKLVFDNAEFQNSAAKFLNAWQLKRGGFEMLVMPEDAARGFLESIREQGQLMRFAREVRLSRTGVPQIINPGPAKIQLALSLMKKLADSDYGTRSLCIFGNDVVGLTAAPHWSKMPMVGVGTVDNFPARTVQYTGEGPYQLDGPSGPDDWDRFTILEQIPNGEIRLSTATRQGVRADICVFESKVVMETTGR